MGLGIRSKIEAGAQRSGLLRRLLINVHLLKARRRRHPFDRLYGTRTGGIVPLYLLKRGGAADADMIIYAGCVPSAVRHVLASIPDIEHFDFFDLGCGLGRALIIASEFGPKSITGIELNPELVARARANVTIVRRRFPARGPIVLIQDDASDPTIAGERTILFLYHPFGQRLVERLAQRIADQVNGNGVAFVIYVNPVHGNVFDADPRFHRWSSNTLPYDEDEIGLGFDAEENVIVWSLGPPTDYPAMHCRSHDIIEVIPGHKVRLRPAAPHAAEPKAAMKPAFQADQLASFDRATPLRTSEGVRAGP